MRVVLPREDVEEVNPSAGIILEGADARPLSFDEAAKQDMGAISMFPTADPRTRLGPSYRPQGVKPFGVNGLSRGITDIRLTRGDSNDEVPW